MQVGDLVEYVGGNGDVYYGIVTEVDNRTFGAVRALLHGNSCSMWFQRRTLKKVLHASN